MELVNKSGKYSNTFEGFTGKFSLSMILIDLNYEEPFFFNW